jgi:hypothetical protein
MNNYHKKSLLMDYLLPQDIILHIILSCKTSISDINSIGKHFPKTFYKNIPYIFKKLFEYHNYKYFHKYYININFYKISNTNNSDLISSFIYNDSLFEKKHFELIKLLLINKNIRYLTFHNIIKSKDKDLFNIYCKTNNENWKTLYRLIFKYNSQELFHLRALIKIIPNINNTVMSDNTTPYPYVLLEKCILTNNFTFVKYLIEEEKLDYTPNNILLRTFNISNEILDFLKNHSRAVK